MEVENVGSHSLRYPIYGHCGGYLTHKGYYLPELMRIYLQRVIRFLIFTLVYS